MGGVASKRRALGVLTAALLGIAQFGVGPPAAASAASPTVVPIGVDHAGPPNHNFEYVDFFPRNNVKVHRGDVLDFQWALVLDGAHTATVLKKGETPSQAWETNPIAVSDPDDGPAQFQVNPAILFPSDPTCGTAPTPCTYNGTRDINSGFAETDGKIHFFVKLDVEAGTKVHFVCLIHPTMEGSVDVVGDSEPATSLAEVQRRADQQAEADTDEALEAVEDVEAQSNGDNGTVTLTAGTASAHVEIVEMLPREVHINAGDTVTWVTRTRVDIHTVTFPRDTREGDPLPFVCETANPPDAPAGPSPPFCARPQDLEVHFNPQPFGTTVIATPSTFGSSGILAAPVVTPFPQSYSFSFPNSSPQAFTYKCWIHERGMLGTIFVDQPENGD